jgi:hypothetical protein
MTSYIDDHKSLQVSKTIFVEVKRSTYNWIFNLDFNDTTKFYRPTESELYRLPYLLGELEDREGFFESYFAYDYYWKIKNNQHERVYDDQIYLEKNIYED